MKSRQIVIAGGGAAGFFAAITCAEAMAGGRVTVFEKGPQFLAKVRISGGGRCNVTHACFDPRKLTTHYPRGEQALIGAFQRFQPQDTITWFAARGVELKTQPDGRLFPVTDSSQTIIDCLTRSATEADVKLQSGCGVESATRRVGGGFDLRLSNGEESSCDRLLLATGGCRAAAAGQLAVSLGHQLEPPVPSLFAFQIDNAWLRELPGIALTDVEAGVSGTRLRERGAILVTHGGVSGPVILRLSAWGARHLHDLSYRFPLLINWLPQLSRGAVAAELDHRRRQQAARLVINAPLPPLPSRLWEQLVLAAGIGRETRWSTLSRTLSHQLVQQLTRTELTVSGKSLNKDEFVTCGGVKLGDVDFKTMESRVCPGLYFAGELLDIDGITGGFNFQAAWTTGWIAGKAMAQGDD